MIWWLSRRAEAESSAGAFVLLSRLPPLEGLDLI